MAQHRYLGKALGPGDRNIFFLGYIENCCTRESGENTDVIGSQHKRWQDEMPRCIKEDVEAARKQGIDRIEARNLCRNVYRLFESPATRKPGQLKEKNAQSH